MHQLLQSSWSKIEHVDIVLRNGFDLNTLSEMERYDKHYWLTYYALCMANRGAFEVDYSLQSMPHLMIYYV